VTSAAPVHFKHFGKYIDGGIKANNPSMNGLTMIHENYKVTAVVSLGYGAFQKKLGRTDVHEGLSKLRSYKEGILNIKDYGEPVKITTEFCEANTISYFRLSPILHEAIGLDEKDTEKLVDMLFTTRNYFKKENNQLASIWCMLKPRSLRASL